MARRIMGAMSAPATTENPRGWPLLRNVMRVPSPVSNHVYMVCMGNGPWLVRITRTMPASYLMTW